MVVVAWLEVAWSCRMMTGKMLARLYSFPWQHFPHSFSDEGGCRRLWFSAVLGGSLERSPAMGSSASLFFLAAAAFYFSLLLSNSQQRAPLPVDLKKRTPIPPIQFID